ncbi:uncharacterized protein LOC119666794 [Teleopsis dalmanni]|uniref:uncharacterized protein LOC119666794 n=1 Tax=Teleopsis dalmanni TaxID=139649 RepID=UPI0018CEECA8|nr:uncharacterized protein LOC119666794 [Teleopsis dalmanni]
MQNNENLKAEAYVNCWDECAKPPPPKISKSIRETWSLHTVSMLQQDSLVLVDVAWAPLSTPNQCLVTWEVSGGGLMGNLLTESYNVQLSLWPDTKYRVQVTCKNKLTGSMSRSMPLTIDTAEAINTQIANEKQLHPKQITPSTPQLPIAKIPSTSNVNEISNSITDSIVTSIEQDNTNVLPYDDDQSAETINQHTNFIFNWHTKNSDISAIEPMHKPNLNILTIATLSDLQKPLLFGVIAGTLLLALILLLYVCMLRQQRVPNDKTALIEEDVHSVVVSMPPAAATANAATTANATTPTTYRTGEEMCKNAAFCSRNALKV